MTTHYGIRVDGGDFITDQTLHPLDLERAKVAAQDLSSKTPDGVVAVVSREAATGSSGWQDTPAAFIDGKEIERTDPRYPGN